MVNCHALLNSYGKIIQKMLHALSLPSRKANPMIAVNIVDAG